MQGIDTVKMLESVALFNQQVNSAGQAVLLINQACRSALAGKGVAHITIPKDIQNTTLREDKPFSGNHGGRTSSSRSPPMGTPPAEQLQAAAEIINAGSRVAILAGSGCFAAVQELLRVAEILAAPIAKAYLAKSLLPDEYPLTTGGIGHRGTAPSM